MVIFRVSEVLSKMILKFKFASEVILKEAFRGLEDSTEKLFST